MYHVFTVMMKLDELPDDAGSLSFWAANCLKEDKDVTVVSDEVWYKEAGVDFKRCGLLSEEEGAKWMYSVFDENGGL